MDSGDEEAKEAEEAYQQIKAFGDADQDVSVFSDSPAFLISDLQVYKSLKKDEQMADLQLIFTEEKGHKNTHW
jgi:hypothetical protein